MSIVTVFWNELYVFVYLIHMRVDKVGMYSFIYDILSYMIKMLST